MTRKPCRMCASTGKVHIDPKQPCGRPDHWIACPTCETRRLRAEVRRLRREKRYVAVAGANLLGLIDAFEGLEGERITDEPEDEAVLYQAREMIDAALARRRRRS